MYHTIFRAKLRASFRDIDAGRYDRIILRFWPKHEHTLFGSHSLAGTRHHLATTSEWYGRLSRIMPDLRFEIIQILSSGWPWNTVAVVEWVDHFTVNGRPESNQGVHMFRFKWGRCTSLRVYCDTQKLAAACEAKAALGMAEAAAAPIADSAGP
jgi:ketosteroid isomerase-like protein